MTGCAPLSIGSGVNVATSTAAMTTVSKATDQRTRSLSTESLAIDRDQAAELAHRYEAGVVDDVRGDARTQPPGSNGQQA